MSVRGGSSFLVLSTHFLISMTDFAAKMQVKALQHGRSFAQFVSRLFLVHLGDCKAAKQEAFPFLLSLILLQPACVPKPAGSIHIKEG